jgi:hypothetical protein
MKLFTALLVSFVVLVSQSAFATKDRGGGNVTRDGALADLALLKDSKELPFQEAAGILDSTLVAIADYLPGLAQDLLRLKINWYTTPLKLDDPGCKLETPVAINAETVACQYLVADGVSDVFIAEAYWLSATDDQKFDLMLHEWFRALQLKRGLSSDLGLFRIVIEIKKFLVESKNAPANDPYEPNELRRHLAVYGFGSYLSMSEIKRVVSDVRKALPAMKCAEQKALEASDMPAFFENVARTSEDLAELLEAKLKRDFGAVTTLTCQQVLNSTRELAKTYQGLPEVLILPRSIRNDSE